MNHRAVNGWVILSLLMSTLVFSYPQPQATSSHIAAQYLPKNVHHQQIEAQPQNYLRQSHQPHPYHVTQTQLQANSPQVNERKFAEKQNSLKKVSLDDIDSDIQTNQIQDNLFSWTNMIGSLMTMFFNNPNLAGPTKSDDLDTTSNIPPSPWTNVIAMGLKIITTLLGGGAVNDGIDKVDNGGGSPMQNILAAVLSGVLGAKDPDQVNTMAKQAGEFINIVVNLLDALKTSFSHRSLAARSIGKKDSVSDFAIASIAMLKGYVKTTGNSSEKCMQKYLCEANTECNSDVGGNSIFCQIGSYATSFALERTTGSTFEKLYEAGRRGRQGESCQNVYVDCDSN